MVKNFLFFFLSRKGERGCVFAVFFAPFPEKGILDYIAHRPIIQVFTVCDIFGILDGLENSYGLEFVIFPLGVQRSLVQ